MDKLRIVKTLMMIHFLGSVGDKFRNERAFNGWYRREVNKYSFHPVVLDVLKRHEPQDLKQLIFEYPHASVTDPSRLSYTESSAKGEQDRQTITTFNRYIRRHFPALADHEIRDYGTKCKVDIFEMWNTSDLIVFAAQEGPRSCMTWGSQYTPKVLWNSESTESINEYHPYRVYDPELGWKMAVRLSPDKNQILGRCLVYEPHKAFVRSFKRGKDYSYSDESLEVWLTEQGYTKEDNYPENTYILHIEKYGEPLLPYLDGDWQDVESAGRDKFVIVSRGDYTCDNTDGRGSNTNQEECSHCGDMCDPDDLRETDDADYGLVCYHCRGNYFVDAISRGGRELFIHENNVIYDRYDNAYDSSYLVDNNIVELYDGSFADMSDGDIHKCILTGEYFCEDDENFVQVEGEWYPTEADQIYRCSIDGEFYLEETNPSVPNEDGFKVNPKNIVQEEIQNV
jgi:hypothetical protein